MTENLSTAYDAIALLESLGLPVSQEQLLQVKQLEQQYIDDVIVPHIQKECEPLLEDLIGGCHLIIDYSPQNGLDIRPVSEDDLSPHIDSTLEGSKSSSYEQDRTKYSFNGGPALPKRRCVLKIVQEYVKDHPNITFEELQRVFPDSYAAGGYYVVSKYDNVSFNAVKKSISRVIETIKYSSNTEYLYSIFGYSNIKFHTPTEIFHKIIGYMKKQ